MDKTRRGQHRGDKTHVDTSYVLGVTGHIVHGGTPQPACEQQGCAPFMDTSGLRLCMKLVDGAGRAGKTVKQFLWGNLGQDMTGWTR